MESIFFSFERSIFIAIIGIFFEGDYRDRGNTRKKGDYSDRGNIVRGGEERELDETFFAYQLAHSLDSSLHQEKEQLSGMQRE